MRRGVRANPKKDTDARRKKRPGWRKARPVGVVTLVEVERKLPDGRIRKDIKRVLKKI